MDRFWNKRRIELISVVVILHFVGMANLASAQEKQYVKLRAGTPVMLEVVDTISSDRYAGGQTVPLVVSRAVTMDDQVAILPNTEVYAKVATRTEGGLANGLCEI